MTCRICGSLCHGRRCSDCEQRAQAEARAGEQAHGDAPDQPAWVHVECTGCGTAYWHEGDPRCPDCGETRCRALGETADERPDASESADGEEEWTVNQQGLGGGRHTGQATLGGGVTREVDR